MLFQLPRLQSPAAGRSLLLRVLTCMALAAAAIHFVHQFGKTRLGLSGDEYYFYYAAAGRFVGVPSDPLFRVQEQLRSALDTLETASAADADCRKATFAARGDLRELLFLLRMESSGQGYGPGSAYQGLVLRAWNAAQPPVPPGDAPYATALGRRIVASQALPLFGVIAACFLALAFSRRAVPALCALGLYVLLHGLVSPAQEAYWTEAQQQMQSPWWILQTAVGVPFLNPRYSDSLFAIAPRGYLVIPFLLALACRWSGATRWSYAIAATLPLFHAPIGTMIFAMLLGIDLLARPVVFADRTVLGIAVAGLALALAGHAGSVFLELAGSYRTVIAAVLLGALAVAYAVLMPRNAAFRRWSERSNRNVLLLDVVLFGPVFMLAWWVLALLFVHYGVVTGYGLVNLATKSGPVAHHAFFFGSLCLLVTAMVRALQRRFGDSRTAELLLAGTLAATALLVLLGSPKVPPGTESLTKRFAAMARAHDETVQQQPLRLGEFQTHLLWHRIVRQRETGGEWLRTTLDLTPYQQVCRLAGDG